MQIFSKKNLLQISNSGNVIFYAVPSRAVKGALDVIRLAGITEHPSPKQGLAMVRKLGVQEVEFRKAFGHMLPSGLTRR